MFKFGHTYIKPNNFGTVNRNGRITLDDINRVANEINERNRRTHGFGQWVIVSSRGFYLERQLKFGRGFYISI